MFNNGHEQQITEDVQVRIDVYEAGFDELFGDFRKFYPIAFEHRTTRRLHAFCELCSYSVDIAGRDRVVESPLIFPFVCGIRRLSRVF